MKKQILIDELERIRMRYMCAYYSANGKPNTFCDCKFTRNPDEKFQFGGEYGNGCPEIRRLIDYIKSLPDDDFK